MRFKSVSDLVQMLNKIAYVIWAIFITAAKSAWKRIDYNEFNVTFIAALTARCVPVNATTVTAVKRTDNVWKL